MSKNKEKLKVYLYRNSERKLSLLPIFRLSDDFQKENRKIRRKYQENQPEEEDEELIRSMIERKWKTDSRLG